MKKFSLVLCIVALVAVMLVGATAFAQSGVTTHEDIFIGEYDHNYKHNSDPNVIIVFGTASVEASANVTERGILITRDTEKWYFPAKTFDKTTGNFGVAIIKATILDGNFDARAYAIVGGTFDEDQGRVVGGEVQEGETIALEIDNVQMTASESEITVLENAPVDLKELITLSGTTYDKLTYTAKAAEGDTAQVAIENGVVRWVNGRGTVTITAKHELSGEYVEFTAEVWKEIVEVSDVETFLSLSNANSGVYAYLTNDIEIWSDYTAGRSQIWDSQFNGILDGRGYTLRYNRDYEEKAWWGLTNQLSEDSIIKNLMFEIDAHVFNAYNSLFANDARGIIENCYIRLNAASTYVGMQNNGLSISNIISRYLAGTVRNVIIENHATVTMPISARAERRAKLENVAWIVNSGSLPSNYVGREWGSLFNNDQMINFAWYNGFSNFLAGTGKAVSYETYLADDGTTTKERYVQTDLTEAQNVGDAWTVDATNGVSFNGEVVRPVTYGNVDYYEGTSTGSIVFTEAGQTEQIKTFLNGNVNEMYSFTSSATSVAKVGATNGLVTAVEPGRAVITAKHIFNGTQITIPVIFAEKIIEVDSADDFATLHWDSIDKNTLIRQTADITVGLDDMYYREDSDGKKYYSVIPGGFVGNGTVSKILNSDQAFDAVYDGQGHTLTVNAKMEDGTKDSYYGIVSGFNSNGVFRNLVYKTNVSNVATAYQFASTAYGYIDGVISDTRVTYAYMSSYNNVKFIFAARTEKGTIRNTIINTVAIKHQGDSFTNALNSQNGGAEWENVAAINVYKNILSTSGVSYGAVSETCLRNLGRYTSLANFFAGVGNRVTAAQISDNSVANGKYYDTPFEKAQFLGHLTVNAEAKTVSMKVNGEDKVVYTYAEPQKSTVSISADKTTVQLGTGDVVNLVGKVDGVESDRVIYTCASSYATISLDGVFTPIKAGSVTVYAIDTVTGASKSTKITITAAAA